MRRVLRAAMAGVLVVGAALTLCLVALAAIAYVRAPALVSAMERSGALAFDPASLPPGRVCALVAV